MSAKLFADGVAALLTGEATFVAAVNTLLSQTVQANIISNTPFAELGRLQPQDLPCWVIEQGNGAAASISEGDDITGTIGNYEQHFRSELLIALVWKEQDRPAAANVRATLPTLVAQLFMRNCPTGVAIAYLDTWEPDRGALHPLHTWAAQVTGLYSVPKA